MRRLSRITRAVALAGALVFPLAIGADLHHAPTAFAQNPSAVAKPVIGLQGGRFTTAQTVSLSAASGAKIYYTLDGNEPTEKSQPYTAPIALAKSANLAAIAVVNGVASPAAIEGYLIKTAEKPLASFAVMSDVHTSQYENNDVRWQKHFDTLSRILPDPDAIISNGDQINDNNFNTGEDHAVVRRIFEENLQRKGMADTRVFMSFGNHDDRVAKMSAMYPQEWFPHDGGGYYQQEINGYPLLVLNTENYSAAQSTWVKERLTAITSDPTMRNKPVFVAGHRPVAGTVMDGMQASNQAINTDLSGFPQVISFSGHSHYNINDERSMFQENFTSVNDGSMTYGENPSQYWPNGDGLVYTAHNTSSQSLIVEVYADRTEIDRINYAAEDERAYTPAGVWSFQNNPPYEAAGTLAGPTWTVRTSGTTPEEIRAGFTYTPENRNKVAPVMAAEKPTVRQTASGPVLRIPRASDDQFVHGYQVSITDAATGAIWNGINPNNEVGSDFYMAPRPAFVDIPLAVRQGGLPGKAIDNRVVIGAKYSVSVTARDSYGNKSEPAALNFVAGELHFDAAQEQGVAAEETRVNRLLGAASAALPGDFALALSDTPRARTLLTSLAAERAALVTESTQDGIENRERTLTGQLAELSGLVVTVDRAALSAQIAVATGILAKDAPAPLARTATPAGRAALESAVSEAAAVAGTLNLLQGPIDAATDALAKAIDTYAAVAVLPTPSATTSPSPTASSTSSGAATSTPETGDGPLANTGAKLTLPLTGGLILLAIGLGAWVVVRRRSAH